MLKSIPSTVFPGDPPKNQPQIVGVGFLRTPLLPYTYAAARPLIFFVLFRASAGMLCGWTIELKSSLSRQTLIVQIGIVHSSVAFFDNCRPL